MDRMELTRRGGLVATILFLGGCRTTEGIITPTSTPSKAIVTATPTIVREQLVLPDRPTHSMEQPDAKWEIFLAEDENSLVHPETGYYIYTFKPRHSSHQWLEQTQQSDFRARLQFIPISNSILIIRNVIGLSTEARSRRSWDTSIAAYSSARENKYQASWEKWMVIPGQTLWNDQPLFAPSKQPQLGSLKA